MELNLPIMERLQGSKRVLIAGMGGGFDVFCGLPLYFSLRERGFSVHLANLTFSDITSIDGPTRLSPTLAGVQHTDPSLAATLIDSGVLSQIDPTVVKNLTGYSPEFFLTRWFKQHGEEIIIWCFQKTGVMTLRHNYRLLVEKLQIDTLILVDGGVDSLIRGDENELGTFVEDTISFAAIKYLDEVPVKMVACIGFGAELDISYAHILENIAGLAKNQALLGSCMLMQSMEAYQRYEEAVMYVQGQPFQEASVINSSIISAVRGEFGDFHLIERTYGSQLWISPLMALYWFFDLALMEQHNYFSDAIQHTETFQSTLTVLIKAREMQRLRRASRIPLP